MQEVMGPTGLFEAIEERATDRRPRIRTGWAALDAMFHRGGIAPGELVILGGRTHTRKTTVMLNMAANMLKMGTRVGLVALDETVAGYGTKLSSCLTGRTMEQLEFPWEEGAPWRDEAKAAMVGKFTLCRKPRPSFEFLTSWLDTSTVDMDGGGRAEVVFIDYTSLLTRDKFAGSEVQRIGRLIEELQVWTSENQVVTIALHQVGRMDENSHGRYHGDTPMTLESLKFGGEEIADIVLGTYRPELDPLGNMEYQQAEVHMGDKFDDDKWQLARTRVETSRDLTYLQLLKNRPGVHLNLNGIMLRSPNEALAMAPAAEGIDDGKVVPLHGQAHGRS